jgi:hypothetical protein
MGSFPPVALVHGAFADSSGYAAIIREQHAHDNRSGPR